MHSDDLLEISVVTDSEGAEAVSELFNRYNSGTYEDDSAAGEASGGGAVIEATGFDDFHQPLPGQYRITVKTYLKPGQRGQAIRRQIEEGLWRLSLIYPLPEPQVRAIREEDWANAWKQFYKPLRVGQRVVLKPSWEQFEPLPDDIVIELDPGMAFGTGLHPTTRLCLQALEQIVRPGDAVLDIGTGSGVLSIVATQLGAARVLGTDIDPLAVRVARENLALNHLADDARAAIELGSVPNAVASFQVIVANILAEVLVGLFDGRFGNEPLAAPLAPGGHLILSGILEDKAELVLDAAARHGLIYVGRLQESDWVALVVRSPG